MTVLATAALTGLLVAGCVAGPPTGETLDQVRGYVRNAMAELRIPGAAVVIVGPKGVELAEGFGKADDQGAPVTPQTPFQIASLSKELTGIAVMQLVDSGDLALDATVHSYVGWFGAPGSDTAKITVRNLLAHTSGWTETDGLVNRTDHGTDPGALERNVRRLAATPPSHPIGQFEYSNANYDVLGYLVQFVSGQPYEEYMADHVFGPLKMTHTFTDEAASRADGLAQGHYPFFGFPIAWDIGFVRGSLPSAYIASSAEDLGHVLIAHLNRGTYEGTAVLSPEATALLHAPLVHPDTWSGYGWGWFSFPLWNAGHLIDPAPSADLSSYQVPIVLEHTGSHITYAGGMALLLERRLGVVILMNTDDAAAPSRISQLDTGIAQILLGAGAPPITSYDEPVRQYGKTALVLTLILMVIGILAAGWRIRRWNGNPASAPRGRLGALLHVALPLIVDLGVPLLAWFLVLDAGDLALGDFFSILVPNAPDVALALVVITVIGIAWAAIRTTLTVRLLRMPGASA